MSKTKKQRMSYKANETPLQAVRSLVVRHPGA